MNEDLNYNVLSVVLNVVHSSVCICFVQQMAIPCRRLVCYCRLCEVADITKKENLDRHQREIFLFNDILLVMWQLCTSFTYYLHRFSL